VPTIAYSLRQIPEERWQEMHSAVQDNHKWAAIGCELQGMMHRVALTMLRLIG
jgi:hypothetical protein